MVRWGLMVAVLLAVGGCGPRDNNRDGKQAGPPVERNPKGPPPMKGPGDDGNPRSPVK